MKTALWKQTYQHPVTREFRKNRNEWKYSKNKVNRILDPEQNVDKQQIKKVVLADDDPGIVDVISIMLEMQGYEVAATRNGASVLEMVNDLPDIFILDIWMSGVDGRDICRTLKSNEQTKHIPIILISASHDIRQSALDSGADDFIEKPFEMTDLIGKIKEYL